MLRLNLFAEDFRFVGHLGRTALWHEAKIEVLTFQDRNLSGGFARKMLRIRASGRKARLLAKKLLVQEPEWRETVGNSFEKPPVSSAR